MEIALQRIKEWKDKGDVYMLLNLSHLDLAELPSLPERLIYLDCFNNQLTYLPELPSNLEILDCSYNKLQTLPVLPKRLNVLDCNHNQLQTLPTLPQRLEYLYCGYNQLQTLPELPEKIKLLDCIYNYLDIDFLITLKPYYSNVKFEITPQNKKEVPEAFVYEKKDIEKKVQSPIINKNIKYKSLSSVNKPVVKEIVKENKYESKYKLPREGKPFIPDGLLLQQLHYVNTLSEEIKDSIMRYTHTDLTYTLNNGLVKDEKFDEETTRDYLNIKKAFWKAPPLTHPIRVFRGVRHSEYITAKSFSSCSLDVNISIGFAEKDNFPDCAMIVINVSRGCRVLPLWEISIYPHEMEVLLEDGGRFIITDIKSTKGRCKKTIFCDYVPSYSFEVQQTMTLEEIESKMAGREHIHDTTDELLYDPEQVDFIIDTLISSKGNFNLFKLLDKIKEKYNIYVEEAYIIIKNVVNNIMLSESENEILQDVMKNKKDLEDEIGEIDRNNYYMYLLYYHQLNNTKQNIIGKYNTVSQKYNIQ